VIEGQTLFPRLPAPELKGAYRVAAADALRLQADILGGAIVVCLVPKADVRKTLAAASERR
jgi:hypothetical protein